MARVKDAFRSKLPAYPHHDFKTNFMGERSLRPLPED